MMLGLRKDFFIPFTISTYIGLYPAPLLNISRCSNTFKDLLMSCFTFGLIIMQHMSYLDLVLFNNTVNLWIFMNNVLLERNFWIFGKKHWNMKKNLVFKFDNSSFEINYI